jgi:hypothetical protein
MSEQNEVAVYNIGAIKQTDAIETHYKSWDASSGEEISHDRSDMKQAVYADAIETHYKSWDARVLERKFLMIGLI